MDLTDILNRAVDIQYSLSDDLATDRDRITALAELIQELTYILSDRKVEE